MVYSLTERYGLNPRSDHVKRVIRELEKLDLDDEEVLRRIALSQLDVGESYFFRDRETWRVVRSLLRNFQRVRVLSLGCAEGEEVYTMAFVSKDEGVDYEITGVDACPDRIEIAKRGLYSFRKLRTLTRQEMDRYFERIDGAYRVRDDYRKGVSFLTANIVDLIPPGRYDFVFLRRVLIYLSEENIGKVLKEIKTRLSPNGYLILGKGEIYEELLDGFEPMMFPGITFWRTARKAIRGEKREVLRLAVETEGKEGKGILKRLMNMGFYDQVESLASAEIEEGNDSPDLWKYLITALMYKGERERAREKLSKALVLYPEDEDLRRLKKVVS